MDESDSLLREISALKKRLSRLSEASLRINESLDPDKVLQEVMDNARALTCARWGGITTLDRQGDVVDLITSGVSPEEREKIMSLPEAPRLYEYFNSKQKPIRLRDAESHMMSLGFPKDHPPVKSFMGTKMLHGGEHVGTLFVAEKEDGEEFTQEDEEMLVMFASQAALVVLNARRHRDEQRARAYLETLVNTSPVGVAVFNAQTGEPVSFNREAQRIVDGLRDPDQAPEQLLDVLTFVRGDGRELSLIELSMVEAMSSGETIRAEEIVLRVPDGRSVRVLLNATPILSEAGTLDSFIVTLQDMAPLEEMERLRADFLAMVSHELRTPLATVKGSTSTLLGGSPDLDPAVATQFHRIIDEQVDHMQDLIGDLLDIARIETGTLSCKPAPVNVAEMVDEARTKLLSAVGRDNVQVGLAPDLPPVMADRRRIVQVLSNLLSNAAGFSPEELPVKVTAVRIGVHVAVSVADEGRGIPEDFLPYLFRKYTRLEGGNREIDTPGSGLGLVICKGIVEAHGGRIWAESDGPGLGAKFTFTVPAADGEGLSAALPAVATSRRSRDASQSKLRILAVDDDPHALRYMRDAISEAGYAPIVTGDPEDVPRLMEEERPHLVLLDLMLAGSDGVELMKDILKKADVPVIFVSAYGQDDVVARAFDMGATDYVVKPFSPTELAARIKAALRRRAAPRLAEPADPYVLGDLAIDYAERRVNVGGQPVELTPTEYGVLYQLSVHGGRALTHDDLLELVWGPERKGEPWLVREVVKRLRRKLDDDARNPDYILTEPRIGYRMEKGESGGTRGI